MIGLLMLPLMYGSSPSSLRSLLCFPTRLHTNTPLLPEVPSVGKTNNICDKENWGHEPGMVAMISHSTPAFGGVPNSSNILVMPDKPFGWRRHFVACQKAF